MIRPCVRIEALKPDLHGSAVLLVVLDVDRGCLPLAEGSPTRWLREDSFRVFLVVSDFSEKSSSVLSFSKSDNRGIKSGSETIGSATLVILVRLSFFEASRRFIFLGVLGRIGKVAEEDATSLGIL